jgi:hypothetical protein
MSGLTCMLDLQVMMEERKGCAVEQDAGIGDGTALEMGT